MNGLAGCYVSTIGKQHEYFDLTTNTTRQSRRALVERLRQFRIDVEAEDLVTAAGGRGNMAS